MLSRIQSVLSEAQKQDAANADIFSSLIDSLEASIGDLQTSLDTLISEDNTDAVLVSDKSLMFLWVKMSEAERAVVEVTIKVLLMHITLPYVHPPSGEVALWDSCNSGLHENGLSKRRYVRSIIRLCGARQISMKNLRLHFLAERRCVDSCP